MAAYLPGFNDRWFCKRALIMHRNSLVLFSLEMQGSTEKFEKISEEEEDDSVVILKVGIMSF